MSGERQALKERRKKQQQQQRKVALMMIVGGALIVVAVLAFFSVRERNLETLSAMMKANTLGDPNAPVVLEIFSDFGCSHCADFAATTAKTLVANYVDSGKLYIVYRSVGGLMGNPNTNLAAGAAYCAGDQNKFWDYHDLLFENQFSLFATLGIDITPELDSYAVSLGLDQTQFDDCLASDKFGPLLQKDEQDARSIGINSTPSFLINGKLLVGNQPYAKFQEVIEAELVAQGN